LVSYSHHLIANGRYNEAIPYLKPALSRNDADAMSLYCTVLRSIDDSNEDQISSLLQKGSDHGSLLAMKQLVLMEKNRLIGLDAALRLIEAGDKEAILHMRVLEGEEINKVYPVCIRQLQTVAYCAWNK
jgi:hypothetical protein